MIKNIFKSLTILFFFTYAFGQVEMAKIENFETNINLYNVNSNFWRLSVSKQNAAFRNLTAIPTIADMFAGEVCLYKSGDDYRLYTRIGNSILHALFNITETTNTWTATQNFDDINVGGFTKLGSDAPSIQCMYLSTTTASVQGGNTVVAHGLTYTKIIGLSVFAENVASAFLPPNSWSALNQRYLVFYDATNVTIRLHATASTNILNGVVNILIWYIE